MQKQVAEQWIIKKNPDDLEQWINAFLIDRKAQSLSKTTLYFYHMKMLLLKKFTRQEHITTIAELTPDALRRYLLWLEETDHNPGGVNACYRVLKTFLLWYEDEYEPEGWKNPIRKIKAPKLSKEALAPIELEEVTAMVEACPDDYLGIRDKALILLLLDTGARASEVCSMDRTDFDDAHGNILIRHGKGGKTRTVYLGKRARKALRTHLRSRNDQEPALLANHERERLSYHALEQAIERAARRANVKRATPHMFRRAFALNCLRAGMDVYSLKELMGHEDLQVLERYLKLTKGDVEAAHRQFAPVDRMMEP
jgi:site-specific recombinase XerD